MHNIKAVFFDLDGTLIDSERFHYDCWMELLDEFGIHPTYEDWIRDHAGIALSTNAVNIVERYRLPVSAQSLIDRRIVLTEHAMKTREIALMPHALEMVRFLTGHNVPLVLVTSSLRSEVDLVFENSALRPYFSHVITRDDVVNGKPDPEPYLLAYSYFPDLDKQECLIFEDTVTGATAAVASGIPCFAIQHIDEMRGRLNFADKVFNSLQEAEKYIEETFR